MNIKNRRQIRQAIAELRKQADVLEKTLPSVNLDQTDLEPLFELGTRYVKYVYGIRHVYRYVKIDAGIVGADNLTGKEYKNITFRWLLMKH